MGFKCGIVGLPNVGKSTLFNALTASKNAQAANFPFCTIDPNIGIVDVPDENQDIYREREYTISGLNSFATAAVKIEFKSTSTIEVPKIKNLRILALAL